MKYIIIILLLVTSISNGQENTVDTKNSILEWTGKSAFSSYSLSGTLQVKKGTITVENDSLKMLSIVIDMKSLNHENSNLKKHLRSKDFFEVSAFSEAFFTLEKPVKIVDDVFIITGEMSIKGIKQKEEINISYNKKESILTFNSVLDRTKYGVTFNSPNFFKKLKENAIADEFEIKGALVLQ